MEMNAEKEKEIEALYEEFRNGNKEGLAKIFSYYRAELIHYIKAFVKNTDKAEDIFQDMFLYIIANPDKYKGEEYGAKTNFRAYLYSMARSRIKNSHKQDKLRTEKDAKMVNYELSIQDEQHGNDTPSSKTCESMDNKLLYQEIDKLPEDQKTAVLLHYIQGINYKEASEIMNKTEGQYKALVHRAKVKLEKAMKNRKHELNRFSMILVIALCLVLLSGAVYATIMFFKSWKKPEYYNSSERIQKMNEREVESDDEIIAILNEFCNSMGITYTGEKFSENEDIAFKDLFYNVDTDNFEIKINKETGEIFYFYNKAIDTKTKVDNNFTEEEVKKIAEELRMKFGKHLDYVLDNLSKITYEDLEVYQVEFSAKYGELINPYQTVRIIFRPDTKEIMSITNINWKYEDTEILITEEEAIEIAKEYLKISNAREVTSSIEIKTSNYDMYYQNEVEDFSNELYKKDLNPRKCWKINIKNELPNKFVMENVIFIDCETGEIIAKGVM